MHGQDYDDSKGTLEPAGECWYRCPKCKITSAKRHDWKSSCGGYEDARYHCLACGHTWWIEGADA